MDLVAPGSPWQLEEKQEVWYTTFLTTRAQIYRFILKQLMRINQRWYFRIQLLSNNLSLHFLSFRSQSQHKCSLNILVVQICSVNPNTLTVSLFLSLSALEPEKNPFHFLPNLSSKRRWTVLDHERTLVKKVQRFKKRPYNVLMIKNMTL